MSHGGKGSAMRSSLVSKETYSNNWDTIFAKKDPVQMANSPDTWDIPQSLLSNASGLRRLEDMEFFNEPSELELRYKETLERADKYIALLKEAAALFRTYETSHRIRGPEHLQKAQTNAAIAERIEAALDHAVGAS